MERKTYKVILNIGYKNESVKYFDRLTKNRIAELKERNAYVILYYDKFFEKYLWFDSKTNEYQKALFNSNLEYYCSQEVENMKIYQLDSELKRHDIMIFTKDIESIEELVKRIAKNKWKLIYERYQ